MFSGVRRTSVHLPEGAKGDMCRAVQDDVAFGRWFLTGSNPVMLRRCTLIPTDQLPVTDDMMLGLLDRTKRLADEAQVDSLSCVLHRRRLIGRRPVARGVSNAKRC